MLRRTMSWQVAASSRFIVDWNATRSSFVSSIWPTFSARPTELISLLSTDVSCENFH